MPKLHFIEWIWRARGHVELDPPLSASEVFERLEPMLDAAGVSQDVHGRTLHYIKDNPAAQDKLATFSSGTLRVGEDNGQPRLFYDLNSPALRLVFLAPLFFLAIAQGTQMLSDYERARQEQEEAAKPATEAEEEEEELPMNAIDEFLGAPAQLSLEERKKIEEEKKGEDKHSARPAYVFAGIFAVLWLFGRLFEPWLLRRRLRNALYPDAAEQQTHQPAQTDPDSPA